MAVYDQVLNGVDNAISAIGRGAYAAGYSNSVFRSSATTPGAIRNTYLNGFFNEGNSKFTPTLFSRLFDEPTYLSFRIEFNFDNSIYNSTSSVDYLPEPLMNMNASEYISDSTSISSAVNGPSVSLPFSYSSYNYLKDALGETKRAAMLKLFIEALKDIQKNYPYYFQSVEGLGGLAKVNATNGIRLKDGENKITVKCLEGLDLKITQLMQLYKNVVWDEVYQRWMLPDMMRYFNMKIYVSEIRLFHTSNKHAADPQKGWMYNFKSGNNSLNASSYDQLNAMSLLDNLNSLLNTAGVISSTIPGTKIPNVIGGIANVVDSAQYAVNSANRRMSELMYSLCNNAINDVMPTICFDCHMCEFDIEDTLNHINTLNAAVKSGEAVSPSLAIKVGKLYVKQLYPLNKELSVTENSYKIDLNDEFMAGSYINELTLAKRNKNIDTDSNEVSAIGRISSGLSRLGFDTERADDERLSYNPGNPDKKVEVLFTGSQGLQAVTQPSAATNIPGALASHIRNNYNYFNTQAPQSEATSKTSSELSNVRNRSDTRELSQPTAKRVLPISDASSGYVSTATSNNQQANSLIGLTEKYGQPAVNDALEYIRMVRDVVNDSKAVNNLNINETDRTRNVISNAILGEVLEQLSASKATNGENVLSGISDIILNSATRSKATDKSNKINAFDALN